MSRDPLVEAARRAAARAYAPYSGYRVGAALEDASGGVFTGANVENASYGLTICAERAAVFAAVAAGVRRLRRIAIWARGREPWPCGACRQVLAEFAPRVEVVVASPREVRRERLDRLLPSAFAMRKRH